LALGASLPKSMAAEGIGPRKRPWEDDVLSNEDLKNVISSCKANGIDLELQSLAKRIAPSEEYRAAAKKCFTMLQAQVRTALSIRHVGCIANTELCGAHAQGLEIDGTDMDVVLRIPSSTPSEERDAALKAIRQRLQSPPQSNFLTATAGMRLYRHAPCTLSVQLKDAPSRTVAHLLTVDAIGDDKSLTLDSVIKQLCDAFLPSRDLVRLVKLWASNHHLVDHRAGHMIGVAWTLLVVFFLQREKYIPSFASLSRGGVTPSTDRPQLSALLRDFFLFLAMRQNGPAVGVSVTQAQEFSPPPGTVLFIEDPVIGRQSNLADSLSQAQWTRVLEEARKAADRLTARPQRWFHWAEILDPRELPPNKLQSLQDVVAGLQGNNHAEQLQTGPEKFAAPLSADGSYGGKGVTDGAFLPGVANAVRLGGKGPSPVGMGMAPPPGPCGAAARGKGKGGKGFGRF